jgi:hypothetical protein
LERLTRCVQLPDALRLGFFARCVRPDADAILARSAFGHARLGIEQLERDYVTRFVGVDVDARS